MKNFQVEQNIMVVMRTTNKMDMVNIFGLTEKSIKEIGQMERKEDMESGSARIQVIKVSGIMDMLKEEASINLIKVN